MMSSLAVLTTLAIHFGTVHVAAAPEADADVPQGTLATDPATSGATEVDGQGTFAAADADARHADDATELEISAGGLLATGNAFAAAVTGQGRLRVRRGIHQVGSQVAGNYGRADVPTLDDAGMPDGGTSREDTVANLQAMLRYDVFFAKRWSAFLMATGRRDRFQGLDLRLNIDPGVAFYALTKATHRLWFEVGYDFQFDVRNNDFIAATPEVLNADGTVATPAMARLDKTLTNHAARVFAGYSNSLSDRVSFDTGVEYLQSVLVGSRFRVNWVSGLTTQLANRIGLGVTFTLRYENEPLPDVAKLDTITAVLLTVRFI